MGYSGVAKDAQLVPIQVVTGVDSDHDGVIDSLGAYESDLIAALEHVLILSESLSIASANMSLGGDVFRSTLACDEDAPELKDAIDALRGVGIATVIASGNDGDALTGLGPGPNAVEYRPNLYPGYYDIYAWWQAFDDNAAADVTVYHDRSAAGHTRQIDQRSGGSDWHFLGTYALGETNPPILQLSDIGSGSLIADAVRWQEVLAIAPIVLETSNLPDAVFGQPYEVRLQAAGGLSPYTWSDPDGSLAALGLSIDADTGVVSGHPNQGGKLDVGLRVTDGDGYRAEQSLTLDVSAFTGGGFGHPYVQSPRPDGVTLIWWTSQGDASAGTIDYGPSTGGTPLYTQTDVSDTPESVTFKLADGDLIRYRHEVTLTGLEPGTTYDYRVTQNGGGLESHFSTAPDDVLTPIRVLVWADPEARPGQSNAGSGAPAGAMSQAAALRASVLASSNLEPDLILAAGDLVDLGHDLDHWDELFRNVNAFDLDPSRPGDEVPLASRVPIQAVLGNHDYYDSALEGAEKFLQHMANPGNMGATSYTDPVWPSELDATIRSAQNERYFALQYGPATFIGLDVNNQSPDGSDLDTNIGMLGENETGGPAPDWMPGSRQHQWLEEALQKADRESLFTFVIFHHPPYSSGPHASPPGIDDKSGLPTRRLLDLLHKYRVDASIHGHEDAFELSRTRGDPDRGGDPSHVMAHYVLPSVGDGVRDKLSDLLNPFGVFHYGDNENPGRHYGMLQLDIGADPADTQRWIARMRVLWLDDAWEAGQGSDPIGGYYDEANPEAASDAVSGTYLPIVLDSAENGVIVSGDFVSTPAMPGAYGATALEAVDAGSNGFRFEPDLPEETASYRLDAYWPASPVYTAAAGIGVKPDCSASAGGARRMDQRTGGGRWNEVGVFALSAGACIEFSHEGPGMAVDAIRLERVRGDQPHVATMALPPAAVDSPYHAVLEVAGGAAPHGWTLFDGELPRGLVLNEATGEIGGMPRMPQIARFTVAVADADGHTDLRTLRITVDGDTALLLERFDHGLLDGWRIVDEGTEDTPSDWFATDGILVQGSNIRSPGNGEATPEPILSTMRETVGPTTGLRSRCGR